MVRNALAQASYMLGSIAPETADEGDSPGYDNLSKRFHPFGIKYASLCTAVSGIREKVASTEFDTQSLTASIDESQVVLACLAWITDPEAFIRPMTLSQAQVSQARRMVEEFKGPEPSAATQL